MFEAIDTWYIPEGTAHHVELPKLRDGNEEGRAVVIDDRGDLLAPCYVQEADHDGLLLLKQYGAGPAFVNALQAAERYGDVDPTEVAWRIERFEDGGYHVEDTTIDDLGDAV